MSRRIILIFFMMFNVFNLVQAEDEKEICPIVEGEWVSKSGNTSISIKREGCKKFKIKRDPRDKEIDITLGGEESCKALGDKVICGKGEFLENGDLRWVITEKNKQSKCLKKDRLVFSSENQFERYADLDCSSILVKSEEKEIYSNDK